MLRRIIFEKELNFMGYIPRISMYQCMKRYKSKHRIVYRHKKNIQQLVSCHITEASST